MNENPTLLVVDDESGPRESLRMILDRRFDVTAVDGGEAAVRALRENHFDVVTLDLCMPGIDGFETLRRIRETDRTVEVVVVSSLPPHRAAWECMRLRAFDVLRKPFSGAEILATAEAALARRRAPSEHPVADDVVHRLAEQLAQSAAAERHDPIDEGVARYGRLLARCLRSLESPGEADRTLGGEDFLRSPAPGVRLGSSSP